MPRMIGSHIVYDGRGKKGGGGMGRSMRARVERANRLAPIIAFLTVGWVLLLQWFVSLFPLTPDARQLHGYMVTNNIGAPSTLNEAVKIMSDSLDGRVSIPFYGEESVSQILGADVFQGSDWSIGGTWENSGNWCGKERAPMFYLYLFRNGKAVEQIGIPREDIDVVVNDDTATAAFSTQVDLTDGGPTIEIRFDIGLDCQNPSGLLEIVQP